MAFNKYSNEPVVKCAHISFKCNCVVGESSFLRQRFYNKFPGVTSYSFEPITLWPNSTTPIPWWIRPHHGVSTFNILFLSLYFFCKIINWAGYS